MRGTGTEPFRRSAYTYINIPCVTQKNYDGSATENINLYVFGGTWL